MSDVSRAAVLVEPERLELQEFPLPSIGSDEGLLRVEVAGICGSDWAQFLAKDAGVPPVYPIIPGHEVVGRIHRVGADAAARWHVQVGDRVAVGMVIPGRGGPGPAVYGLSEPISSPPALWGGYAEFMYLDPRSVLYRVPDGVSPAVAALFGPLANGITWTSYVPRLAPGDRVVVQGPGQQGLGCLVAAKEAGASLTIVTGTGRDSRRLEVAKRLGADVTVNVDEEEPVDVVRAVTGGDMADVVVDVSAEATAPVACALDMVRRGGTIVLAGLKDGAAVPGFVSDKIVLRGITVVGSSAPHGRPLHDPDRATRKAFEIMASRRYPLDLLCTHTFDLAHAENAVKLVGRCVDGDDGIHVTIAPDR